MQFVQKLRQIGLKLLNLRLVDRRKRHTAYVLVNPEALQLHLKPITVRYDSDKDMMEYNLYTRAVSQVKNPKDIHKIVHM